MSPDAGLLIEVATKAAHGSAAAMGPTYERLGLEGAQALGLAMAYAGLCCPPPWWAALIVVLARSVAGFTFGDALPLQVAAGVVVEENAPLEANPHRWPTGGRERWRCRLLATGGEWGG